MGGREFIVYVVLPSTGAPDEHSPPIYIYYMVHRHLYMRDPLDAKVCLQFYRKVENLAKSAAHFSNPKAWRQFDDNAILFIYHFPL